MNVFDCIRLRRSIRRYKADSIEDQKLDRVLEAGRLAPSAANRQPCHFIVIKDKTQREALRASYNQSWFVDAPVILVVCAVTDTAWVRRDGEEYWKVDGAIALQNMVLCAKEEGLGTCWIAAFSEEPARKILNLPQNVRIVAMTPLGYPDEIKGAVTDRKPLGEMIHHDHW